MDRPWPGIEQNTLFYSDCKKFHETICEKITSEAAGKTLLRYVYLTLKNFRKVTNF